MPANPHKYTPPPETSSNSSAGYLPTREHPDTLPLPNMSLPFTTLMSRYLASKRTPESKEFIPMNAPPIGYTDMRAAGSPSGPHGMATRREAGEVGKQQIHSPQAIQQHIMSDFDHAYSQARAQGQPTFTFNGRLYDSELHTKPAQNLPVPERIQQARDRQPLEQNGAMQIAPNTASQALMPVTEHPEISAVLRELLARSQEKSDFGGQR